MKQRVFVTRAIPEVGIKMLQEHFVVAVWPEILPPSRECLISGISAADGLLSLLTDKVDGSLLDVAPNLRIVSNYAVGFDNLDLAELTKRGILATNTPGVLTETTADLAFTLMLSAARRIVESASFVKNGHWQTWGPELLLGQDIYGAKLGLFGFGRIGQAVARRAKGFAMRMRYFDVVRQEHLEEELGIEYVEPAELLATSDFVSIHAPLNDFTRHFFDREAFTLMKKTAILINTARGAIINEKDLYQALGEGRLAGAALDVTDPEPMEKENPLLTLDNVLVVPHIASASHATRNRMAVMAAKNLIAGLQGQEPPNLLNPEVMRRQRGI